MKNRLVKKIVAGKFKGVTLNLPSLDTTRSSKNIVLESFFNTVQFEIIDAIFVECFAGSGSIGLEALSRGAKEVVFMEQDKEVLKVLRSNIAKTDPSRCRVVAGDSFENINQVIKNFKNKDEDLYFYIDPPFSIREGKEQIYEQMLNMIKSIPKNIVKMVVVEHMSTLVMDAQIGDFVMKKSKKFGVTTLTYYV